MNSASSEPIIIATGFKNVRTRLALDAVVEVEPIVDGDIEDRCRKFVLVSCSDVILGSEVACVLLVVRCAVTIDVLIAL